MRIEARDMYAKNDRQELAAKEEYERSLFSNYMPAGLTEEQLNKIITQTADKLDGDYIIFNTNAKSYKTGRR